MKINKLMITAMVALLGWTGAQAQDTTTTTAKPQTWTLRACIDYAKAQNVTVRKNKVSVQSAAIDLADARAEKLPTVSFSTNQQYSNRPFQSKSQKVIGEQVVTTSSKNSYSGNYAVNASMPLYDGGKIKNTVKLKEINSQIAELTVEQSELNIEEQITKMYVQILYARETIKQDEEQIALAETQLKRAQALFKSGLLNKADVSQLESQLATDKYQKVADQTTLDDYKLQLKQLLELDGDEAFDIPEQNLDGDVLAPLPNKSDVYATALTLRPEIRAQQLAMGKSDIDVKIAKASMLPTVNLSAGVSTNNTTGNGNMFTQLKDSWNNGIGVTVSVPIFDHGKTKNAIAKAKLEKETSYLELLDNQKTLWKTIESYWLNANSAQQRYVAAKEKVKYAKTSYELTSEQFRLGLKNILELVTDKTTLVTSQQQMTQAKYTELLNAAMLKYYNGETINL